MPPSHFLIPNVVGALAWVGLECGLAYYMGAELKRYAAWVGIALGCCVVLVVALSAVILARYEKQLALAAERSLPDELKAAGEFS